MDEYTAALTDNLFSATGNQWAGMEELASTALNSGINKFQEKDYAGAAKDFQRAFRLSPYSDFAYEATKYSALAYQAGGETDKAIKAYEQAIQVNQTDDRLQLEMGNILFGQARYGEAIDAFEEAVRLYDDPTNRFSLGQAYNKTGRYQDAENQFGKIIRRGGAESRNGYFGMGQAFRAQGKYDDAIEQFELAIRKDSDFNSAYEEMGYTYVDAGKLDEAEKIEKRMEDVNAGIAALLSGYINKNTQPRIMFGYADSSFPYYTAPKAQLSVIDGYLANAGAEKTFSVKFQFSKEMDRESIENPFNWSIERSTESAPGMRYNHGLAIPDTEVRPPLFPINVYYDADALTATVRFSLTQNDTADGTIDPSHIVFSFNGRDANGNEMDADYDQFMGFSKSF
jgi:Flp pilus assembly protein TadD